MWAVGAKLESNIGTEATVTGQIDGRTVEVKITSTKFGRMVSHPNKIQTLPSEYWEHWHEKES